MNLIKKTTLALTLLAAAGTSFAQTATKSSNGLLGQRYAEFSYSLADLDSVSTNGHGLALKLNAPVVPALLDVGAGYEYDWIGGRARGHANTFTGTGTAYVPLQSAKVFFAATLGYQWTSLPFNLGDHDAFWNAAVGFEIPVGALTVTPRIVYGEDFNGKVGNNDTWTYEVEGNYWFSAKTGAFASAAFEDIHRSSIDIWIYKVGLRFRF